MQLQGEFVIRADEKSMEVLNCTEDYDGYLSNDDLKHILKFANIDSSKFENQKYTFSPSHKDVVLDLNQKKFRFGGKSFPYEGYIIVDVYGDEWIALAHLLCNYGENIEIYTDAADGDCVSYVFAKNKDGKHKEIWYYDNDNLEADYDAESDPSKSSTVQDVAKLLPPELYQQGVLSWCHSPEEEEC